MDLPPVQAAQGNVTVNVNEPRDLRIDGVTPAWYFCMSCMPFNEASFKPSADLIHSFLHCKALIPKPRDNVMLNAVFLCSS